ncbi:uncharacterized protein LOC130998077 [Salvia miltiorrhiza]|uniref:uncharacterized protein LOC130998077 n=1 Tax=Salvia miltiorrhiza TaxID=226208 RepID=UPI0025AD81A3|nr:uncharacterized protein LOC130998077 [Salvia miltiorrhiza]
MSWRSKCGDNLPDTPSLAGSGAHGPSGSASRTSPSEQPAGSELIPIPPVVEIPEGNVEASHPFDAEEVDAGALVHRRRHSSAGDTADTREEDIQVVDIIDEVPSPDSAPDATLADLTKKRKRGSLISVGEKERQEGLKKAGKSSEPARRSAGGVKILTPAGDKGKGPAKKSAGGSKVLPSAGGKGKGKAVVPSAAESEDLVPGPISSLSGKALVNALLARVHSEDQEKVENLSRASLATQLCQLALQVESRLWGAVKCIHDYDMAEKEREKEQVEVAKRDDVVAGVVERLSKAEAEIVELKAKLAQVEVERASLASELSRATKEGHECLARFKASYERDYEEARRGWKRILVEAQNRAFVLGARDQRLEYFLSPRGQHFLGLMLEEKPEWWYPVLEKAIPYFSLGIGSDSLPSTPVYAPAFSASLARFVNRLRDPSGESSRTFSQFGLEPPLPSDLAASVFTDSAPSPAAVGQLFDLYQNEDLYVQEAAKLLDLGVRLPQVKETGPLPVFTEKAVSGHASASGVPPLISSASAPVSSAAAQAASVPPS